MLISDKYAASSSSLLKQRFGFACQKTEGVTVHHCIICIQNLQHISFNMCCMTPKPFADQ